MSGADAAARFWAFSLAVYPAPGVKPACLALQEALGLDVNLALWCAWTASEGRDPSAALEAARTLSEGWSAAVVKPLRAARDALKPAPDFIAAADGAALRKRILDAELEAERLEQVALAPLSERCPEAAPDASAKALCRAALDRLSGAPEAAARLDAFVENVFSAAGLG